MCSIVYEKLIVEHKENHNQVEFNFKSKQKIISYELKTKRKNLIKYLNSK